MISEYFLNKLCFKRFFLPALRSPAVFYLKKVAKSIKVVIPVAERLMDEWSIRLENNRFSTILCGYYFNQSKWIIYNARRFSAVYQTGCL